ncbi:MAG: hypothetical protein IT548_00960 [Alphaproteobacteria bacterium]|nr:hypothetical protein [Alphaproteobacteria bacterium]
MRALAGDSYFARGEAYFRSGAVRFLSVGADRAEAAVQGTRRYRVRLSIQDGELAFSCTCPLGRDDVFCKHVVAVGLSWRAEGGAGTADGGESSRSPPPHPEDALRERLLRLDKGELVSVLIDCAGEDERLMRRLTLLAARQAPADAVVSTWKRAFDDALATDDYVEYRGAYDYASGVDDALDTLEGLLRDGRAGEIVELAEYALEEIEEALNHVDDSDGFMSGALARAQELHLEACRMARPEPVELAERLFELELGSSFDACSGAYATYSDILGETGRAAFRRLAEAQWAKVKPLAPGEDDDERYGRRFRITSIMETIAKQAVDLEAQAAVMARNLSRPYDFLKLAELYRDAGDSDKALDWAERGSRAFAESDQDKRLRAVLAEAYQERGRRDEAMGLMWAGFEADPHLQSYLALKAHAQRARAWKSWREKALALVRARVAAAKAAPNPWGSDHSLLVQIFLHEGDDSAAWREAREGGCSQGLWLELAKLREASHPEDAVRVYRDHITRLLRNTGDRVYEEAIKYLEKIETLMKRGDKMDMFAALVREVRATHALKRKLTQMLDRKGWR